MSIVFILSAFQQRNYFTTMQIYVSPVLNPLSSIAILFPIGKLGHYIMGWREKPTVNARNGFLQVFIKQISESRGGEGGGGVHYGQWKHSG